MNLLPLAVFALIPSLSFAQVQQAGLDPDSFTTLPSPPLVTQPASKFFGSGRAAGVTIDTTGSDNYTTADFMALPIAAPSRFHLSPLTSLLGVAPFSILTEAVPSAVHWIR